MGIKKKIGIMGGTFNPIHNGHLLLAEEARECFNLDEVLFMPSGNSYMKNAESILDGRMRAEMTALAIKTNPHFKLSLMEIERKGPTYTFETVSELKRENPDNEFFFLMGADSLLSLEKWKNPDIIFKKCTIIVAIRGNDSEPKVKTAISGLCEKYQAGIRLLPVRHIDISSSEIRERLVSGKSVRYMIPEAVLTYIYENHLYQLSGDRK